MKRKIKDIIKLWARPLVSLHNTPHEIALGVAIGLFIGFLPIFGLQTFIALGVAFLIPHTNKLTIIIGSLLVLPPAVPFVTLLEYRIGRWLLPGYQPEMHLNIVMHVLQKTPYLIVIPAIIGTVILGFPAAVISYYAVKYIVERLRKIIHSQTSSE